MDINQTIDSLDKEITEDGKKVFLYDVVGEYKDNTDNICLYEELDKLSKEELLLLKNRYFLDKTQSETAKSMNVTQVMVSRKEKEILQRLRTRLS